MDSVPEASPGVQAEANFPKEPMGSQVQRTEEPAIPAEERRADSSGSSRSPAGPGKEPEGAGQDLAEDKLPSPRSGSLRAQPLSLGYGAFRRLGSTSREPPSPSPMSAEQPRDGEGPGAELLPRAAPGEQASGTWAPVELQVDVRVKPVGAPGGSPAPAPSTRFLTVPVPESPAFSRHASPAHPLLQRAASPGATRGRGSPLAASLTERDRHAEGQASLAEEREGSRSSPTCGCGEPGLEKEDAWLRSAGMDGQELPRAIKLIGLPMYIKSLRWALVVLAVFLAVCTVTIVVLASRAEAVCQPCPPGWMWSEERCFYLSAEAQDWAASQAFCVAHNATLPLFSHTQDLLSRHPFTQRSWVGAHRGPHGWHWIDGVPLLSQLPKEDLEEPDLSCGGLEEGRLVALNCSSPRPWVCVRGKQ
ncbi:killer cell lectin-like receptor subfamily G member 2 [Perognathus longimembris pacificus]|uniref:killer cell lectin-like receptor subfamily G member 2 n=1 Tax=Perognathus longimembris pacificus TaxID=214514 RepID=UPI0020195A9B|nr:killer cell lectin-like receptor subfamily G member 2 [Perognathus longimembris pacificus]